MQLDRDAVLKCCIHSSGHDVDNQHMPSIETCLAQQHIRCLQLTEPPPREELDDNCASVQSTEVTSR